LLGLERELFCFVLFYFIFFTKSNGALRTFK
jgi:hypothetical protein